MNYDPKSNLRFWPTESMSRFGQNPYGGNLYRIVFAPSRRHIVYGEWPDGSRKADWVRTYADLGDCWVLEKWLSAYDFTKCTAETWNMMLTVLGPYPDRGEYELVHAFEACPPADANLDKLISWIEAGRKYSAAENLTSLRKDLEEEETGRRNQRLARISNALPAFGAAAMSGPGGGRGTKTMPMQYTAEELNLPTKRTMRAAASGQRVDVQQLIEA